MRFVSGGGDDKKHTETDCLNSVTLYSMHLYGNVIYVTNGSDHRAVNRSNRGLKVSPRLNKE